MTKLYNNADGSVTIGPADKYRDLIEALGAAAKIMQYADRPALQRLAWSLGMAGESHACQAIMEHAKEPTPIWTMSPWGYMPSA